MTSYKAAWYFGRVCLSVCQTITFEALKYEVHIAHPVYLQEIRVKFVYEGHRVKVKVTRAKSRKFPQCETSIACKSGSVKDRAMFACVSLV